jgi:hypothetical protein
MTIIIDDGNTFKGTLEQFEECFFSHASVASIIYWAGQNDMKVEFRP